jgi:uncharacterized membrane protein
MLNLSAAPAANPIPGDPMAQASLGANDAWQWIVRGWQLFLKNPVVWVVLTLIYIVSLFVLNMVPVVGALLAAVLTPVLIAGLLFGANELDQGRALTPAHLFQAFQDQPRLLQLALLGMVPLAVTLLQKGVMALSLPQELTTLIGLVLSLAGACVLLFGLPLVMLGNKTTVEAVPASLRACLAQPLAVAVFLGLALLLMILAMIPLGLGLLVYLPVMVGAVHAGYRQVL